MDWIDELFDEDESITPADALELEILIDGALISPEEKRILYSKLSSVTLTEFRELMGYLRYNQRNPVTEGRTYSQTDIKNQLKRII